MTLTLTHPYGPFANEDLFVSAMSNFVNPEDIFNCGCVCKLWNQFAENPFLWKSLFASKGIPMVVEIKEASPRHYRHDFRVLYPVTTVSGEAIRRTLGEPVGEVPCIPVEIFDRLSQPDPFDLTKFQKETCELIVEPQFIERVLGTKECPLVLDEDGNLVEAPPLSGAEVVAIAQTPTRIPFTLLNRITLAKYPLMGKEHMPVFRFANSRAVFQSDYCPLRVNIYYQTRRIVEGTRKLPYSEQEAFVKERGMAVMPLGPRVLSNEVQILQSGTCHDDTDSYARSSDPVCYEADVYQSVVGDFSPRGGMRISHDDSHNGDASLGVVAGGPAEVPAALRFW